MSALAALQDCLAAEHAAVYGYGVLGGVLSVTAPLAEQDYAAASYAAHRARRDNLTAFITRLGKIPQAAEPVYATPFAVTGVTGCRRLARRIEHRTAAVYCFAVSETVGEARSMLAAGVVDAAIREVRWGGAVTAFPGAAEL